MRLLKKLSLLLVAVVFIMSCNQENKKTESNPEKKSDKSDSPCDTGFVKVFKKLTDETISEFIPKTTIGREITDEGDVKSIANNFYSYIKFNCKIDTTAGITKPRLCLGVDFSGSTLTTWILKMNQNGATNIKVLYGMYDQAFLSKYSIPITNPEYETRIDRFTAILVAYNSSASDTPAFVGAYNLGGMQP